MSFHLENLNLCTTLTLDENNFSQLGTILACYLLSPNILWALDLGVEEERRDEVG
jgi:hypothetical protein